MTRESRTRLILAIIGVWTVAARPSAAQEPVGTAFTYQGQLKQSGQPANGSHDFAFALFDAAARGNMIGSPVSLSGVNVVEGLFTVQLNVDEEFAQGAFTGDARWLEIAVNGTTLSPRQEITAAPYSLAARTVTVPLILSGSVPNPGQVIDATNTGTGYGVRGVHAGSGNLGLLGVAAEGVFGSSATAVGVWGEAQGATATGVQGAHPTGHIGQLGTATTGVHGSGGSYGVIGSGNSVGVAGFHNLPSSDYDYYGYLGDPYQGAIGMHVTTGNWGSLGSDEAGVRGYSASGLAGWFDGPVHVDGNVGIGTLNPGLMLHLVGENASAEIQSDSPSTFPALYLTGPSTRWALGVDNNDEGKFKLVQGSMLPGAIVTVTEVGNVGIGTTGPVARLHVNGTGIFEAGEGDQPLRVVSDSTGAGMRLQTQDYNLVNNGTVCLLELGTGLGNTYADLRVRTSGGQSVGNLVLQSSGGNVGIGTTTPQTTLDVNGTTRTTAFQLTTSPQAGRVLTSDPSGIGTWQPVPTQQGIPSGVIVMWSGTLATIPSGWALCNGTNGTPDLRDRFTFGTSPGENPGATGGSTAHNHGWGATIGVATDADPMGYIFDYYVSYVSFVNPNISGTTSTTSHLPPYYKLAFIMKL